VAAGLKLKAQLVVDGEIALGPGKADLLEAIAAHGSISAAARAMGLSYRRAWLMVDAMNRLFARPLVQTARGGPGGAALTPAGRTVLAEFRALQARLEAVAAADGLLAALKSG
jgi:molybdate transport system regulatory protein